MAGIASVNSGTGRNQMGFPYVGVVIYYSHC